MCFWGDSHLSSGCLFDLDAWATKAPVRLLQYKKKKKKKTVWADTTSRQCDLLKIYYRSINLNSLPKTTKDFPITFELNLNAFPRLKCPNNLARAWLHDPNPWAPCFSHSCFCLLFNWCPYCLGTLALANSHLRLNVLLSDGLPDKTPKLFTVNFPL